MNAVLRVILTTNVVFLEPLNDSFLMNLAEKLGTNYLQFGVYLGLTSNKIDQITFRCADLVVINFKILKTWRNCKSPTESANVMFDNLREALLKIKRTDLEEQVRECILAAYQFFHTNYYNMFRVILE